MGFASAEQSADAAVRLLRRYYLEFGRKSALDIVRRWAPAECRVAAGSVAPAVLAVRGIANTLRARWLAARRTKPVRTKVAAAGAVAIPHRPAPTRVSAVPLPPLPPVRMQSIMAGLPAPKATTAATLPARVQPRRQPTPASVAAAKAAVKTAAAQRTVRPSMPAAKSAAARPAKPPAAGPVQAKVTVTPPPRPVTVAAAEMAPPPPTARPAIACAPDEQRIQNYAGRMVQGLDLQPGDDLKLFEPDGRPLPNLARVLLAMSSFELGYLRASVELVEAAIERARPRPALLQQQEEAAEPLL